MSVTAAIRRMMDRGLTIEQALIASEAFEAEMAPEQTILSKRQARNKRYYEGKKASENRLKTSYSDDQDADSLSPKEIPPTPPKEITPILSVSEASASSTVRPEPAKAAPVSVIGLPTVSDGDFPVTADDIAEWQTAFPAVNVRQQLASMRQWLIANQTKRKTARGMKRFVVSWLDRKQNEGGAVPSPRGQGPPYPARTVSDVLGEMAAGTWTGPRESLPNEPFIETSFTRRN